MTFCSLTKTTQMNLELTSCLCCGNIDLFKTLDLGLQPLPNALTDAPCEQDKWPLQVNVCSKCFHSQLSLAVDSSQMFSNYPYRTGVSETLKAHYKSLAEFCDKLYNQTPTQTEGALPRVLDVGCNDCTLLNFFSDLKYDTSGVDPSPVQTERSHKIHNGFWGTNLSFRFSRSFDIITATNVLAHTPNPKDFLQACRVALKQSGFIVIESPYNKNLIENSEFDTIYHEHISYFIMNSISHLLRGTGLYVSDVSIIGVHGGSFRIVLRKCSLFSENHCQNFRALIRSEREDGFLSSRTFHELQDRADLIKHMLKNLRTKEKLIAFGASGKGTVLLNYTGIRPYCIVDETPSKIGRFSPGLSIPIVHPSQLTEIEEPCNFLILVWNCLDECIKKLRMYRKKASHDIYTVYVPAVECFSLHEDLD